MLLLHCPNCGARNVSEFRFGGETNPRPKDPATVSEAEWVDYLHMRENLLGVETEWWHHRSGCGLWFLAERHTLTNQVLKTYLWSPQGTPLQPLQGAEPTQDAGDGYIARTPAFGGGHDEV